MEGAALVFFAFVGFDALSTAVEEAVTPQRSIPIAIVTSLIICTLIYIVVSGLLTGIVPYQKIDIDSPVADALIQIGYRGMGGLIAAGATAGLTTVSLVMFYGLSRICLAISKDGLMPNSVAHINKRTRSPVRIILAIAVITALVAGLAPISRAAELVNIGTLAAFAFVCAGVIVFRITHPDIPRPFKLPLNPVIPILGVLFCIYLMLHLPMITWYRFIIWTIIGILIYFLYGIKHSHLKNSQ
jgi:APA family basic amino acid/polyamine antiporter